MTRTLTRRFAAFFAFAIIAAFLVGCGESITAPTSGVQNDQVQTENEGVNWW